MTTSIASSSGTRSSATPRSKPDGRSASRRPPGTQGPIRVVPRRRRVPRGRAPRPARPPADPDGGKSTAERHRGGLRRPHQPAPDRRSPHGGRRLGGRRGRRQAHGSSHRRDHPRRQGAGPAWCPSRRTASPPARPPRTTCACSTPSSRRGWTWWRSRSSGRPTTSAGSGPNPILADRSWSRRSGPGRGRQPRRHHRGLRGDHGRPRRPGGRVPLEELPHLQKDIIRRCIALGRPAITATQMLESMVPRPPPPGPRLPTSPTPCSTGPAC